MHGTIKWQKNVVGIAEWTDPSAQDNIKRNAEKMMCEDVA